MQETIGEMVQIRQGLINCPSCNLWTIWRSWKDSPMIERKCIKCGRRVRVKLDREGLGKSSSMYSQGRGRPRAASIKEMPRHLPRDALKKILLEHNRWEARGRKKLNKVKGYQEGFVPASSVVDDLNTKEMGKRFRDPSYWKEILD